MHNIPRNVDDWVGAKGGGRGGGGRRTQVAR